MAYKEKNTMKHFTIVTGICAVLLIATIFVAGCASSSDAPAAGTGAVTQNTQSIAPTPAGGVSLQLTPAAGPASPDQRAQVDSSGDAGTDAATVNADAAIDPFNSTNQSTTMVPDSEDLGDPIP